MLPGIPKPIWAKCVSTLVPFLRGLFDVEEDEEDFIEKPPKPKPFGWPSFPRLYMIQQKMTDSSRSEMKY